MNSFQFHRPGWLPERSRHGFSVVELLAVIAVLSLLVTVLTPALGSITGGRNVARALDVVISTATAARQAAMTKGSPVALVVSQATHITPDDSPAVMLLLAPGAAAGAWTPMGNWTKFPPNVDLQVFLRDGKKSFYSGGEGPLTEQLPLKLNGKSISAYDYIIFYPDGSVSAPANGPALTFRRLGKADSEYTLIVQSNSGRTKVIQ